MLADTVLVAGKELKEVLLRQGGARATILNFALMLGIFGVVIPLRAGVQWTQQPMLVLTWVWLPLMLVSAVVADSFAGERERHTLETLLASRLSDRAILFGKIGAAVAYAFAMLVVLMALSLVTVNVAYGTPRLPLLWPTRVTVAILALGLAGIVLIATIGVAVSLGAKTVRQASQWLSLGMVAVFMVPLLAIGFVTEALPPASQQALIEWLAVLDGRSVLTVAFLTLVVLDVCFVALAMRMFRRSRLVFD